jgi:N-acetylmuramic acid 6-phosphate etherase
MPARNDAAAGRAATDLLLGIDGGGSRCTAVLAVATADGIQELGRGQGGAANAGTAGFEAAAVHVAAAVAEAFVAADRPAEPVGAACLGLAGAGRDEVRDRWLAWARQRQLADRIDVVPDGVPAFGASGNQPWGLLVIAGTGSIVWGRREDESLVRCGGRGSLVGDEGSGWAVAVAGLRAAVRMDDGWGPKTALLDLALSRFDAAAATDLPAILARPAMARGTIAAFAADVVTAAAGGDREAERILNEAAADLGHQAAALGRRLGFRAGEYPLRVAGGLVCHSTLVREGLTERLCAAGLQPAVVIIAADLADAAARMAGSTS